MMKIAVDAMGGDYAPGVVVEGIAAALYDYPEFELVVVGHTGKIQYYLEKYGIADHPRLRLVHAESVVEMWEPSANSLRGKKDSSITMCAKLLRDKEVDAMITPGHTGATVAATKVLVRTLPGVDRPALAANMPAQKGRFLLIDAGANPETTPRNLVEFAIMGSVYSEFLYGIENPTVGIISVGGEDSKGNDLTKETFKLLEKAPVNFIGNVEANTVFEGNCNVLVADGFTGNVFLKCCEGIGKSVNIWLKHVFKKNAIRLTSALINKSAFIELKSYADADGQGGAPLLGINGICIIGHGSSSPLAVSNAIRLAGECLKFGVNEKIAEKIRLLQTPEKESAIQEEMK